MPTFDAPGDAHRRGRPPRISGHFADPADAEREARLEDRLNREFEDPVHRFIDQIRYRTFVLSRSHVRQLTRYVSLLFNRSEARRSATKQQVDIAIESSRALLANEERISQVAGKWTFDLIALGQPMQSQYLGA
ncbi:MAG TPA: hypothetical protein VFE22_03375 [Edaphobacter sp.]|nr:hypothetical protein [Edaphobacter sp.]